MDCTEGENVENQSDVESNGESYTSESSVGDNASKPVCDKKDQKEKTDNFEEIELRTSMREKKTNIRYNNDEYVYSVHVNYYNAMTPC